MNILKKLASMFEPVKRPLPSPAMASPIKVYAEECIETLTKNGDLYGAVQVNDIKKHAPKKLGRTFVKYYVCLSPTNIYWLNLYEDGTIVMNKCVFDPSKQIAKMERLTQYDEFQKVVKLSKMIAV